jgi:hypothetical protein
LTSQAPNGDCKDFPMIEQTLDISTADGGMDTFICRP